MFRITNLIKSTLNQEAQKTFDGNIVIWNFTNRCNLECLHCYSRASMDSKDILEFEIIKETIDEFAHNKIKFIIFSGGEPLVRKDIFKIAAYAKSKGIITYLSTNGLFINDLNIEKIIGIFDYIGISIDGDESTHDYFRGQIGAYKKSLNAMRLVKQHGGKVGIRFTMTKDTIGSLGFIFDLAETEGFDKIYLSHLVYSGRGFDNQNMDLSNNERINAVNFIIDKAIEYYENNKNIEIVTGNMECDAILFLKKISKKYPAFEKQFTEKLIKWGGNSAGNKLLNIDSYGNVKPDPFFPMILGNVTEKSFTYIWNLQKNQLLENLRHHPRILDGKCKECEYLAICNGGSRSRSFAVNGDLWQDDPSCYIGDII